MTVCAYQPSLYLDSVLTMFSKGRVYFTGPPRSNMGVLFLTDIFGVDFVNSQLVADSFGAQG